MDRRQRWMFYLLLMLSTRLSQRCIWSGWSVVLEEPAWSTSSACHWQCVQYFLDVCGISEASVAPRLIIFKFKGWPSVFTILLSGCMLINKSSPLSKVKTYFSPSIWNSLPYYVIWKTWGGKNKPPSLPVRDVHRRGLRLLGQLPACPPRLKLPLRRKYIYIFK